MTSPLTKHPAKFSEAILEEIAQLVWEYGPVTRALDPFAGTGRVHWLKLPFVVGVEIEPEWTTMEPGNVVANTLALPFPGATFDAMITSPSYGNRMADAHYAKDGSRRRSYTHDLRASTGDPERALHPDNSGRLQWGPAYRSFHERAWAEVLRTLTPGALIVLNVSNHIRRFQEQFVTEWHLEWFLDHGCYAEDLRIVKTDRLRDGENREARVDHENVFALRYVAPVLTPEDPHPQEDTDGSTTDARDLDAPNGAGLGSEMDTGDGR